MSLFAKYLVRCGMGKRPNPAAREIFLGQWLEVFGITQAAAGEIGGCSQSYIANISAGRKNNVNAQILLRIADFLEIKVDDFFQRPPPASQIASLARISTEARSKLVTRKQRRG